MNDPMAFDSSGTLIESPATIGERRSVPHRGVVTDRRVGPRVHTGIRAEHPGRKRFGGDDRRGQELTLREIAVLAEYVTHGTSHRAAVCMGRSVQTVKNHLTVVHVKTGAATTIEALRRLGWLVVPPGALSGP